MGGARGFGRRQGAANPSPINPVPTTPIPNPYPYPHPHPEQVQAINAVPSEAEEAAAGGASSGPKSVYSGSSRNWAAIDSDLKQKEEEEKPEGEEARAIVSIEP